MPLCTYMQEYEGLREEVEKELGEAFTALHKAPLARALVAGSESEGIETLYDFVDEESVAAVRARVGAAAAELAVCVRPACMDTNSAAPCRQCCGCCTAWSFQHLPCNSFGSLTPCLANAPNSPKCRLCCAAWCLSAHPIALMKDALLTPCPTPKLPSSNSIGGARHCRNSCCSASMSWYTPRCLSMLRRLCSDPLSSPIHVLTHTILPTASPCSCYSLLLRSELLTNSCVKPNLHSLLHCAIAVSADGAPGHSQQQP